MSHLPLMIRSSALLVATLGATGCGDAESPFDADASGGAGTGNSSGAAGASGSGGGSPSGGSAGSGGEAGSGGSAGSGGEAGGASGSGGTGGASLGTDCAPLPAPAGTIVHVDPSMTGQLKGLINNSEANTTFVFANGTYALNGAFLWISATGVTLRSASGNPADVVLDGGYQSTEVVTVSASDVTVAELTIRRAYTHGIHVTSSDNADTVDVNIYRVHVEDSREQAIKINPNGSGHYTDRGQVACSRLTLSDTGRPQINPFAGGCYTGGVDAHQARDWVIRDNHIEGFWCSSGLSEHGVHMWRGSRDTIVERNIFLNNARAVGFGLSEFGSPRTYSDSPCPAAGSSYVGHYGGVVRNNFIVANRQELFDSAGGFDAGIAFWYSCNAKAVHNSIVSTGPNFSSIEWRFATSTGIEITNNIVTHPLRARGGASGTQDGNLESASLTLFEDAGNANLHLAAGAAAAIDQGAAVTAGLCDADFDGEPRGAARDIGADER